MFYKVNYIFNKHIKTPRKYLIFSLGLILSLFISTSYSGLSAKTKDDSDSHVKAKDHDYLRYKKFQDSSHIRQQFSAVGTGPYFGLGLNYDGRDLVVLQPSIHKDLALLKENQHMLKATREQDGPKSPYVQLGGISEVQFVFETQAKNSVDLTGSSLDLDAWINKWLTAFANFGIELDENKDNNFRMILAFIAIGNLDSFPVYASIGQMFVPFGSFSTGTSDMGTLTRNIGRIYQRALSIGYYPGNGFHLTGSVYNGRTRNSKTTNLDQFAGTASFTRDVKVYGVPSKINTGVSYTNNLADTARASLLFNSGAILTRFIAATDVFLNLTIGPLILRGEYVTALEYFSSNDVLQNLRRVKPSSYLAEVQYNTYLWGKGAWLTLHYSEAHDAAMASIIQHQSGVNGAIQILKNTLLSIEYSHRKNYSQFNQVSNNLLNDSGPTTNNKLNLTNVGGLNSILNHRTRNVLITTLDVFF